MNIRQLDFRSIFSARSVPSIFWIIVAISSCLALLLILFLVVQGYRDGIQRSATQKRQQVAILLQRASDLLDEGRRQEALAAYGIILELDANSEAARDAISAVEAMPPAQAIETGPVAPDPLEIEWAYALSQYEAGNLQEAIARMIQLRAAQPDFRREEMAETLSGAYFVLGRQMAEASSLEEAVQLYDKALELKPNDAQIQVERHLIAGYVDVKTYWGADWTRVINLLEDLYRRDPNYRNVRYLLQRAHVEHGEGFARAEEWCAATAEYTSAIAVLDWMELRERRVQLAAFCEAGLKNRSEGSSGAPAGPIDAASEGVASALASPEWHARSNLVTVSPLSSKVDLMAADG